MSYSYQKLITKILKYKGPPPFIVHLDKFEEKTGPLPSEAWENPRWWNPYLKRGWYVKINPNSGLVLFRNRELERVEANANANEVFDQFEVDLYPETGLQPSSTSVVEDKIIPNTCIKCGASGPLIPYEFSRSVGSETKKHYSVIKFAKITVPTCQLCNSGFKAGEAKKQFENTLVACICCSFIVLVLSVMAILIFSLVAISWAIVLGILLLFVGIYSISNKSQKKKETETNTVIRIDPDNYFKFERRSNIVNCYVRPDYASSWILFTNIYYY